MNDLQIKIWQNFGASFIRSVLQGLGLVLIAKGILTQEQADALVPQLVPIVLGIVISGVTAYFQYRRAKYNNKLVVAVHQADPSTPLEVIKTDVKAAM